MSLKALHIVFVTAATLLAAVFGAWAMLQFRGGAGTGYLMTSIAAFVAAVGLVAYGRWFLKKLKNVSYLG